MTIDIHSIHIILSAVLLIQVFLSGIITADTDMNLPAKIGFAIAIALFGLPIAIFIFAYQQIRREYRRRQPSRTA